MQKPVYSSEEHKSIIEVYLTMSFNFAQEVSTKTKYNNYLEVVNTIIEYSNSYGGGARENGTFHDWLMIIPINLSVATNGFFAGIETKSNSAAIRAYKVVLEQMVQETANKLYELEITHD
tara:strand:- start:1015 stop:1374 length:360 start_codon:yes stop_codon:yes gene_type:complete